MPELREQEKQVSEAFSRQSSHFDAEEEKNPVIQRLRKQVQEHVLSLLKPGQRILELNAGTGIDALFFAEAGFDVVATDNAEGMLTALDAKRQKARLEEKIQLRKCSFNDLSELSGEHFDHIFSNFGGLNCAGDLRSVIAQFHDLLEPEGMVTLVIMPSVCPWELLFALKGNFRLAFRRLSSKGVRSHLEGVYFNTYYYSPRYVKKAFGSNYETIAVKGLGILSPPPYLEQFPSKHPAIYKWLCRLEEKIDTVPPFNACADHFVISVRRIR